MAKTVDELVVKIRADTKDLRKKLDKTNKQLKKTGEASNKASKSMVAGFSKAKVAVVAFALVAVKLVKEIAKVGMEFEDLRDSLNTVFGSIEAGADAMGRILAFAQTTPFQVETVTKAFIALKSAGIDPTNRDMQIFADTASTMIDQLGVFEALVRTVQRSAAGGMGLEELNMIMDRGIDVLGILKTELGLTKMEIAKFGATSEGAKILVEALKNGLEKQFGGAMASKMDNLSTKTSNLVIAIKSLSNEIYMSGLSAFLKDLADKATEATNQLSMLIAASRGAGIGMVLESPIYKANMTKEEVKTEKIRVATANIAAMKAKTQDLSAQLAIGTIDINAYEAGMQGLRTVISAMLPNIGMLITTWDLLTETTSESMTDVQKLESLLVNLEKALISEGKTLDNLKGILALVTDEEKKGIMFRGQALNAINLVIAALDKERGATEQLTFANKHWDDIMLQLEPMLNELGYSADKAREMLTKMREEVDEVADTLGIALANAVASAAHAFTKDFVDALLEGESALESFKNFAQNIVSQIISIFLQMAIVNEILNAIFSGVGGYVDQPTLRNRPPKKQQSGGSAQRGQPTWVGEGGPEIFIPHTAGTIMNAHASRGVGGQSIVINQSLNFSTGIVPTVRAEVIKLMPHIANVTKASVFEAANRGGQFSKTLRGG